MAEGKERISLIVAQSVMVLLPDLAEELGLRHIFADQATRTEGPEIQ